MTAQEFREARKSLGLSQSDLAALIGLSRQSTVSDYETGKAPVSAQSALLMSALLDGWRP